MKLFRLVAVLTAILFVFTSILLWGSTGTTIPTEGDTQPELPIIIIDAGHGGIDGGTSGTDGTAEKDINLSIAKKLETVLVPAGFRVIMTREEDDLISDPSLPTVRQRKREDILKRLAITNEHENCVLISIHQNYYSDSFYSGAQVFYSKNNAESAALAESIQDSIVQHIQPENTRQIKPCGSEIYLLDNCTKPAVMVECGFMSNLKELSLLKNEKYQTKMAFSIALSLISFYT